MVLPGVLVLNTRITVKVLTRTVATAAVNTALKVICWRMQVAVLGQPIKSKEQKKHKTREMSRT